MRAADQEYYRRRERQERETAERTRDESVRRLHLEMADRYVSLAEQASPPAIPIAARP
ncbi:hypothetical protein [Stakelama tenebrarum]|uniref:Uncharacterized protein n=1 Tax=Stakelama tenebrarum TaxID=2711215 RepID=A0A6G6Y2A3_9SPHN|nr:hypothetical protein [Sphingosinithalassobacter tenebrarum]QIG78937.1 hypothetical protein G5C33_03480 [Sphingosinithalassobacter tenebrarum]